jgi:predicted MFS family arabinose efflux permease
MTPQFQQNTAVTLHEGSTSADLESGIFARERGRAAVIVALIAFLTLVDLFATQALLPSLARAYRVTRAAMGFAVNATTIGMAVSSLAVALLSQRIDRRLGVVVCLAVLAIPTSLLAVAPDLMIFTGLRVAQGLCMAGAFTLTLAYLGEHFMAPQAAAAFAAYITGNVASNFIGRLMSAALADHFGIATNFLVFAILNLSGALMVYITLERVPLARTAPPRASEMIRALADHLRNPPLISTFAIGFCILFAFIGTFTYVNFVLALPPIGLGMMAIGFVYFVFLPSMFTTPAAGGFVRRFGYRMTASCGLAVALAGLPLLIAPSVAPVAAGLTLVGVGTFFAQAVATGFVGRVAMSNRGAASGLYLASYFSGGLVGSAVLGQIFDRFGWPACVLGIGLALAVSLVLATQMRSEATVAGCLRRS